MAPPNAVPSDGTDGVLAPRLAVTAVESNMAVPMLHLFLAPAPSEAWGEYSYNGTTLSQLLAALIVIVSVGGLTLAACRILLMLLADEWFELPDQKR
jgi:hypothetical protein